MWNVTVPSTCKDHSAKEMGGPMPLLDHKASDIHGRETNAGGKDNALTLLLLQNNSNNQKIPNWLKKPQILEAVSKAHC